LVWVSESFGDKGITSEPLSERGVSYLAFPFVFFLLLVQTDFLVQD
jgi:hypothetical protein